MRTFIFFIFLLSTICSAQGQSPFDPWAESANIPVQFFDDGGIVYDPDAQTYNNRVRTAGGIVIDTVALDSAIKKAKQDGWWSNIIFWVSARFGVKKDGSNLTDTWYDIKGNDATATGTAKPVWVSSVVNGKPIMRFDGVNDRFILPNFLAGNYTEAEGFIVLKCDFDPSINGGGNWYFGTNLQTHYTFTDGTIYDNFSSNARKTVGNPTPSLTNFHLYNVGSKSNDWKARLNGTQIFTTSTNTVAFNTAPELGSGGSIYLDGDEAEVIILSSVVTASIRTQIETYINSVYQLY